MPLGLDCALLMISTAYSTTGKRVLVKQTSESLTRDFLPRLFSHNKADNFHRQFASYNFSRVPASLVTQLVPAGESAASWKAWENASFTSISSAQALTTLSPKAYASKKTTDKAATAAALASLPLLRPDPPTLEAAQGLPPRSHPTDIPVYVSTATPTELPIAPMTLTPTRPPVIARMGSGSRSASATGTAPPKVVRGEGTPERRSAEELAVLRGMSVEARAAVETGSGAGRQGSVEQVRAADSGWGANGGVLEEAAQGVPWGTTLASDEWDRQVEEPARDQG